MRRHSIILAPQEYPRGDSGEKLEGKILIRKITDSKNTNISWHGNPSIKNGGIEFKDHIKPNLANIDLIRDSSSCRLSAIFLIHSSVVNLFSRHC